MRDAYEARHSAIYEGRVRHHRFTPRDHAFGYGVYLSYLDLDEVERICASRWLWSSRRLNLIWFRRSDYLGPPDVPLSDAVRDRVEEELGRRPSGSIRMLTQLRTLGYVFNPVTFYYCFGDDDALEAVVAEITNTPWDERHSYVLDARASSSAAAGWRRWEFDKAFHVSPFFDMDQKYLWRFQVPGEELRVHMTNFEDGKPVFTAGLELRRRPLTSRSVALAMLRHPFHTAVVHLAIYWQAARLWAKRAPFFTHPDKRPSSPAT
jgi:DUF1365 family protein